MVGCSANSTVDLLEARLREQQDEMARLQEQLRQKETELEAARRETQLLRRECQQKGCKVFPEQFASVAWLEKVRIHPLLSGGLEKDNLPGDDGLLVFLVPQDADGDLLKVPGRVQITAEEASNAQPIGHWDFTEKEVQDHWVHGLVGSGYQFELQWEKAPTTPAVLVKVTFTTPDGRTFRDSRQLKLKLSPNPPNPGIASSESQPHTPPPLPLQ